jgi:cytidylate kinase
LGKIIIAIDGHSSCGKSTLAKALAARLGYGYVDTGAMYRAITLHFLRADTALTDAGQVDRDLASIQLVFKNVQGKNHIFMNNEDVEAKIRTMPVSKKVSEVAAIPAVRRRLVQQQQEMGLHKGIVMDGRDIGTVVFPEAELKLFMTAQPLVRAQRRLAELRANGQTDIGLEEVMENLRHRDYIDSTREDSPLRQAPDAHLIDNSFMGETEQLSTALRFFKETNPCHTASAEKNSL